MSNNLFSTTYNNFNDMPYMNGGEDVSKSYISDVDNLKDQIKSSGKYLDSSEVQTALGDYYEQGYHTLNLNELEKYVASAFVENENLSKSELKNKLNYAIKTENLHKNIENNKLYNPALQKMVDEDISLDTIDIENITQNLHNQMRNLDIRRYYDTKMQQQIGVVRTVVIIFLVLLFISLLYKLNILNGHIYIALIGIGLACVVIFTIGRLMDILMRDNHNFDEYAYIRSHHYLNKGSGNNNILLDDIPSHEQKDLISDKCLRVMNDNSNN